MLVQVLVAMRVDLGSDGVEVIVSVRASVMHIVAPGTVVASIILAV